ncbi:MAG: metalloregulator ArsR/SmtB family transcription factor [Actinomycetota bacterium]|jgi:ArsR family transcriptional regulator|nr:metalloregulator ArsR/SmtB family transcription factor [Actinomycetota bacterium]
MDPVDAASRLPRPSPRTGAGLSHEHAVMLARSLKVVANATRLQLLSLLLAEPEERATVGGLTEGIGLRQPTVTHHLTLMHEAGLLEREPRGRQVWYSVNPDMRDTIVDLVT